MCALYHVTLLHGKPCQHFVSLCCLFFYSGTFMVLWSRLIVLSAKILCGRLYSCLTNTCLVLPGQFAYTPYILLSCDDN